MRVILDGDVEETYDGADMQKIESGGLTGKSINIRITEGGSHQVSGFMSKLLN